MLIYINRFNIILNTIVKTFYINKKIIIILITKILSKILKTTMITIRIILTIAISTMITIKPILLIRYYMLIYSSKTKTSNNNSYMGENIYVSRNTFTFPQNFKMIFFILLFFVLVKCYITLVLVILSIE